MVTTWAISIWPLKSKINKKNLCQQIRQIQFSFPTIKLKPNKKIGHSTEYMFLLRN